MGRYTGPTDRLSRREGVNLMLKGARSLNGKSERRIGTPPGMHSWRRGRVSDYGIRLREKQKVKRYYGIRDRQFMNLFRESERMTGATGVNLLGLLERRLDNAVYKLGFAPSRPAARQAVAHGHISVNGRKCDVASRRIAVGDTISVKSSERSQKLIRTQLEELGEPRLQNWLKLDMSKLEGEIIALPTRDDIMLPVEEQLIVEFCSR
ncbi:MAG: 30S ribosomal protein S4 [Phycisphaerales bacterium]|jgi:small subunit ribosomal protein S4|nr:30S ribosomal protein S4 [Phycisphaerales bacterium]MBT7171583.1 30S ribosomal protein S4 [Phycisphaerales bacterium]